MPTIIAIDEAGRGPVLGNLVMCGISIDQKHNDKLRELGVKDSKLLSVEKREALEPEIKKLTTRRKILEITPQKIDHLIKHGTNLNQIELLITAKLINQLEGDIAIVDCPSPNLEAYKRELQTKLTRKVTLMVEHKADLNHIEVGAASILAKVHRDNHVKKLQEQYDANFGSGYMSDPLTKKFIEANWDKYPELFRHSWSSWKDLKANKDQKKLGDY